MPAYLSARQVLSHSNSQVENSTVQGGVGSRFVEPTARPGIELPETFF